MKSPASGNVCVQRMIMSRTEIRFAGYGGQGVVLAGVILGTAAALHSDKHALQNQSYGAAARGGAARSDIIISDEPIIYPRVISPDIMVAFTGEALDKYLGTLKERGILVIDEHQVEPPEGTSLRIYPVPATEIALNEFGRRIVANMIMLGYLATLSGLVSIEALEAAVMNTVPAGTAEMNIAAFKRGVALGNEQSDTPG